MRNDTIRSKLFTRRALALLGMKSALMLTLVARLYYLQIIKAKEYKTLSESNRVRLSIIPPTRGKIRDRLGNMLAENQNYYRVLFDPVEANNTNETLTRLTQVMGFTYEKQQAFLARVKKKKRRAAPLLLYDKLTWEQVAQIEVNIPDLPGIAIDVAQVRHYPYSEKTAHVLGYVGTVTKKELNSKSPLLQHPDFRIGKTGIEKIYEEDLRGEAGVKRMEVNALGRHVRELSREKSQSGKDLELTIDIKLQKFVSERIGNKSGACVVMNCKNGEVLSLVSTPSFNPNKFAYSVSEEEWQALTHNPYAPMINKAIGRQYPPGSTFKPAVALAALIQGIDPHENVFCPGSFTLGNRQFNCWKKGGHGYVNMEEAIQHSCNVYFYHMSQLVGIENIAQTARTIGLGEKTGLDLPGERSGLIPDKRWKRRVKNTHWHKGDTLNASIGQGFILATPMQLALMTACIANGQEKVTPTLVAREQGTYQPQPLNIPEKYLELVRAGMYAVVNKRGGTARGSRIWDERYAMAAKTGTAQVVASSVNANKEESEIPWYNKNHALFVGYAPVRDPQYAIAVTIEHGGSGSFTAAPIGSDILYYAQKHNAAHSKKQQGIS